MPISSVVKPNFRAPTRYSSGVNTNYRQDPKNKLGFPDPTQWHEKFTDFDSGDYASGWVVNGSGTPAATEKVGDMGLVTITTTTGATDETDLTPKTTATASWTFDVARKFYFETRFYHDATTTIGTISAGLIGASTLGSTFADGFLIQKAVAGNVWKFLTKATAGTGTSTTQLSSTGGTSTSTGVTGTYQQNWIPSLNGTVLITYGFAYEGRILTVGGVTYYIFTVYQDANDGNGIRMVDVPVAAANFPANTIPLQPVIGILNSTGVARNIVIDYVMVAKERFNA